MTKCCVIGGAGFIGSRVTRLLSVSGRDVWVLGRRTEPVRPLPKGVVYVSGDYGDGSLLRKLFDGAEEAIDLAYSTVPQSSFIDPIYDMESNLPPSVGLLQEAKAANLEKVVLVSSGGTVYGAPTSIPIREDHPTNPVSPYGITKLTMEKYGLLFHYNFGLPVVTARPGNAYGEDQLPFRGQGFVSTAIHSIWQGKQVVLYGEEGTIRDYLHVDDVASGLVAILTSGRAGEAYNVGSGHGRSNRDVLQAIEPWAQRAHLPIRMQILPRRTFDVQTNVLDAAKLSALGWRPKISFEDGIAAVWDAAGRAQVKP